MDFTLEKTDLYISSNSFSSSFPIFCDPFVAFGNTNITLVGRFVIPAAPNCSFECTKMYCTPASSHKIGTCVMTSIGDISPAMTHNPSFVDFNSFTTSFTPLLTCLNLDAVCLFSFHKEGD
jgi:hypothetical protein